MIKKYEHGGVVWIDLEKPSKEDLTKLATVYKIHPLLISELETTSTRSRVDLYDGLIYMVLHFPNIRTSAKNADDLPDAQEVDFILGKNFVITAHYHHLELLNQVSKSLDAQSIIIGGKDNLHAGLFFYFIVRELYQSLEASLDYINSSLKRSERGIFAGEEIKTVELLSDINRNLIDFKWSLKHHHEILNSLAVACRSFYGEKFEYYMRSILSEFEKIWATLESHRETFMDLRRTNDSLLAIKTSEATKTLTAIAFFTFTLSTLAAIFGMNMRHNPLIGIPYDFWVVTGIMALITLGIFLIFRSKKWL